MRDSRIGSFGVCALVISLGLRWSALAAIAAPRSVLIALLLAHTAARAGLPLFMALVPPARTVLATHRARALPFTFLTSSL